MRNDNASMRRASELEYTNVMRLIVVLAVLLGGITAGCQDGPDKPAGVPLESGNKLAAKLASAVRGDTVNVADATNFAWDSLFVFGPYTPVDIVHSALGEKWEGAEKSFINQSERIRLVVFKNKGKVVRGYEYSRGLGGFADPVGWRSYSRSEAVFPVVRIRRENDGKELLLFTKENATEQ